LTDLLPISLLKTHDPEIISPDKDAGIPFRETNPPQSPLFLKALLTLSHALLANTLKTFIDHAGLDSCLGSPHSPDY
jgi:hypothetical protein